MYILLRMTGASWNFAILLALQKAQFRDGVLFLSGGMSPVGVCAQIHLA